MDRYEIEIKKDIEISHLRAFLPWLMKSFHPVFHRITLDGSSVLSRIRPR